MVTFTRVAFRRLVGRTSGHVLGVYHHYIY